MNDLPQTVEEVALANAQEVLVAERTIRAARIREYEALAKKAETELETQRLVLAATRERCRVLELPEIGWPKA